MDQMQAPNTQYASNQMLTSERVISKRRAQLNQSHSTVYKKTLSSQRIKLGVLNKEKRLSLVPDFSSKTTLLEE